MEECMIIKVEGIYEGVYCEETYENVLKYKFINNAENMDMSVGDVYSGGNNPFSGLKLYYGKDDFEYVFFNSVAYCMTDEGKTIDRLRFDNAKEYRYR